MAAKITEPGRVLVDRLRAPGARETRPTGSVAGSLFGGAGWPESALQTALGNRLRLNLATEGSPLFAYSWSYADIGLGPPILRMVASAAGAGLWPWPTPVVEIGATRKTVAALRKRLSVAAGGDGCQYGLSIQCAAQIAGVGSLEDLTDDQVVERGPMNPDLTRWLMGFPKVWSRREWIGTSYRAP